jgi:dUTPase
MKYNFSGYLNALRFSNSIILFIIFCIYVFPDFKMKNKNNSSFTLNICPVNLNDDNLSDYSSFPKDNLKDYYRNYKTYLGDAGVDLMVPYNVTFEPYQTILISYFTSFVLTKKNHHKSYSYYLFPRSSLSLTPLRFINSVGIINSSNQTYIVKKGDKLIQICAPDLSPMKIKLKCNLPPYGDRGKKGFGSTNL